MKGIPKITVCVPAYNSEKTLESTLKSALLQSYPGKEILVCDDGSTDDTVKIAAKNPDVRVIRNEKNMGIGYTLVRLMNESKGKYVVYLCADDMFANEFVVGDIVAQFDKGNPKLGVIGRTYFEFIDGVKGAVGVFRDKNIITSSCNPSGVAFKKTGGIEWTNRIFIEMPSIVAQYLKVGWEWTMLDYDSVAVRIHPGGNTGTKTSYYNESPLLSWGSLIGEKEYCKLKFYKGFVQLKNRAPKFLLKEIFLTYKWNKDCVKDKEFWFYSIIALIVPGFILRELSKFYRNNVGRNQSKIIERGSLCIS